MGGKVFKDQDAERIFITLYEKLSPDKQKVMGQMTRDLFWQKIIGDGEEFYITVEDVRTIWNRLA